MRFNYDGRYFRTVGNSPGGETGLETVFHYRQEGDVVWATYQGGEVLFGTLLAKVDDEGRLDMRYQQLNRNNEWKISDNNQRVKVYRLTAEGKRQLASEHSRWEQLSAAIARALNPQGEEGEA